MSTYSSTYGATYGTSTVITAQSGAPWTLYLGFYDDGSGASADPSSVQLDITYGSEVGFIPDYAGPFTYAAGQVTRLAAGQYAFLWQIPAGALTGVYVANWTVVYGGVTYLAVENFPVTGAGAGPVPVPSGDVGYWTGGIINSAAGLDVEFGQVDGNGITWLWNKIDGWDGADVAGGVIQRAGDHGAWPSPQYFQARTLTWTVTASAPTQALRDLARTILQQAVPVSDLAVLRYDEPVPKQAYVRRSGKVTETYPTLCDVTFTVGLVAPDPRKYGTVPHSQTVDAVFYTGIGVTLPLTVPFTPPAQPPGGSAAVLNAGNFETRPVIAIAGPITGPAVTNITTGQTVSYTALTLGADDVLTIDFGLRQGRLNGAYRPADPFSSWWTLPPGASTLQLTQMSARAGASMTVYWSDSYI